MADVRQLLHDFLTNFSCHGAQRAFYPIGAKPTRVSKCFRCVWLVIWTVAAIYMIRQCVETLDLYSRHETVLSVAIRRGEPVLFPAITICPTSSYSKHRIVEWLRNCHRDFGGT